MALTRITVLRSVTRGVIAFKAVVKLGATVRRRVLMMIMLVIEEVAAGLRNSQSLFFCRSYAAARQSDSASSLRCGTGPDLGLSNLRALGKSASRGAGAEWLGNGSILEFWTIVALRLFSKLMMYGRSSAPGAPNLHKGIEFSMAPWAFAAMKPPQRALVPLDEGLCQLDGTPHLSSHPKPRFGHPKP